MKKIVNGIFVMLICIAMIGCTNNEVNAGTATKETEHSSALSETAQEKETSSEEKTTTETESELILGGECSIDGFVKALKANDFKASKVDTLSILPSKTHLFITYYYLTSFESLLIIT